MFFWGEYLNKNHIIILLLFIFLTSAPHRAYSRGFYFWSDYALGTVIDTIYTSGDLMGLKFFKVYTGKDYNILKKRVGNLIGETLIRSKVKMRLTGTRIVILDRGTELNAFFSGTTIYLTVPLIKVLNDRQLIAVIAHELAHGEKAHVLIKTPLPIAVGLYQLFKEVSSGEIINPQIKHHIENYRSILENSVLGLEMEADCVAAVWLDKMHQNGYENISSDLNSATQVILGSNPLESNVSEIQLRAYQIKTKSYLKMKCWD